MKHFIYILIFLFPILAKAQYFDAENTLMNAINFKNVKANSIYNTYKNKPTELEILLNKLNTINSDSIKTDYDLANIAILKSLRNLELK